MKIFEITNDQRQYFGLTLVAESWDRVELSDKIIVYFLGDKILKVLNYTFGYVESDVTIDTRDRKILIPKTLKGKEQKLTIPRILKIKGSGIDFTGSFLGGGIHVYDNRRNIFFIRSFSEEGDINNYQDIENWISSYISKVPLDYFEWLKNELSQKRLKIKVKEGDIVAYKVAHGEYGFARVLLDVFTELNNGEITRPQLTWFHPRSLIVAPYAHYAQSLKVNIDNLVNKKTLPTLCIFDLDVYLGQMPIVGHKPLSQKDKQIPFPKQNVTSITIPYTKTDIETFIAVNGIENN